jgi:hypothetical protein
MKSVATARGDVNAQPHCAALIGDGRTAEFLLLEQFSNGVNNYTRGNGSGTSRNDFPALPGIERGVP